MSLLRAFATTETARVLRGGEGASAVHLRAPQPHAFIDWAALSGLNLILAMTGQEACAAYFCCFTFISLGQIIGHGFWAGNPIQGLFSTGTLRLRDPQLVQWACLSDLE